MGEAEIQKHYYGKDANSTDTISTDTNSTDANGTNAIGTDANDVRKSSHY